VKDKGSEGALRRKLVLIWEGGSMRAALNPSGLEELKGWEYQVYGDKFSYSEKRPWRIP